MPVVMSYSHRNIGMTTSQLWNTLVSDNLIQNQLSGVLPSDQLMSVDITKRPCLIVSNTEPSWKAGRHWTCFYVPENACMPIEFFDSLGHSPYQYSESFVRFLAKHGQKYVYSSIRLQAPNSNTCGEYVLFFAAHRSRGKSFVDIVNSAHSDRIVKHFVDQFYPDVTRM